MTNNNPIQDINIRKKMLKMEIRQQEMEIEKSVKDLGTYFTFPTVKNTLVNYLLDNPETAFRAGMMAVNVFSRIFSGSKRKTKKRGRTKK